MANFRIPGCVGLYRTVPSIKDGTLARTWGSPQNIELTRQFYSETIKPPKIVVSGFEPFGVSGTRRGKNASWIIVEGIKEANLDNLDVLKLTVKQNYTAEELATDLLSRYKADIWIAFGEDESRKKFQIEMRGESQTQNFLTESECATFYNNFKLCASLKEHLNKRGFDTIIDYEAGKFVCEEVLHTLLAVKDRPKLAMFIHTPIETAKLFSNGIMVNDTEKFLKKFGVEVVKKTIELYKLGYRSSSQ